MQLLSGIKIKIVGILLLCCLQACAYMHVRVPLDDDVNETKLGSKVGYASTYGVLGLVAWGDASTEAAAKDGGLEVINHLDREYFTVFFGAYARATTIAYGD